MRWAFIQKKIIKSWHFSRAQKGVVVRVAWHIFFPLVLFCSKAPGCDAGRKDRICAAAWCGLYVSKGPFVCWGPVMYRKKISLFVKKKNILNHEQLGGSFLPVAGCYFFSVQIYVQVHDMSSPGYIMCNISLFRQFVDLEEVSLETKQLWCTQGQRSICDTFKDIA